jgi:hypothetical protein
MLFGKHLGRRHHRGLIAVLHRVDYRPQCNHGLAAAHIAHHQAIHLRRRRHVRADFLDRAALGRRQFEWQSGDKAIGKGAAAVEGDPGARTGQFAVDLKRQFEGKELVGRQRLMCGSGAGLQRIEIGVGRRLMKVAHRLRQ